MIFSENNVLLVISRCQSTEVWLHRLRQKEVSSLLYLRGVELCNYDLGTFAIEGLKLSESELIDYFKDVVWLEGYGLNRTELVKLKIHAEAMMVLNTSTQELYL